LNYYRLLLQVRKHAPALIKGDYIPLTIPPKEYLAFLRKSDEQTVLVVLNFLSGPLELDFSSVNRFKGPELRVLFSSAERLLTTKSPRGLTISPFEVFIAEVQPAK
jgi:maltooligosyltrehalose synthase